MKYGTILCDPPWRFQNWSMEEFAQRGEEWARRNGRSPYDTMDTYDICALGQFVRAVADRSCTLLLWATAPKLRDAFLVLDAWQFEYKTCATWAKMYRDAAPRIGLGYHFRSATEFLLLATRGKVSAPEVDERACSLIFNPIGEHSAKPEVQYEIAEKYGGPYLEMFARPRDGLFGPRSDWTQIGNEVRGLDIREELRLLATGAHPCLKREEESMTAGAIP